VELTQQAALFALQVGVVLVAAKAGGELFERALRQPAVLGELIAGVLIGPYALGAFPLPGVGPLFGTVGAGAVPIPVPLWVFAELAAVVLLFVAGLETNFASFVRFGPTAMVVACGGVILPFLFGDIAAVASGLAPGYFSAPALFIGAALTATSVGVTARVLGDLGRLDTPEGITILGAAVFDDVIGILVLAVVVAVSQGSGLSALDIGLAGGKAIGAWLLLTGILIVAAHRLAAVLSGFRSAGATLALTLAIALIAGYIAQAAGLAMIVGAFSAGVALSRSRLRNALAHDVRVIFGVLVPIFFVVVGMLVDVPALASVIAFGTVVTVLAIAGKVVGCALPALALGFNRIGALRVGIGMIPRGEVALIIAGIGLASGAVGQAAFAVVVFMTFATTILAPLLLQPAFRGDRMGFGVRPAARTAPLRTEIALPAPLFPFFERHLIDALRATGFQSAGESVTADGIGVRELRRGNGLMSLYFLGPVSDLRRLRIESESAIGDWEAIVSAASDAAVQEATTALRDVSVDAPVAATE
jgi:Kef-type K+ transport system membrane component KefB